MMELRDTAFFGPFEMEMLAEDSSAGLDSVALYYMLPEETLWSRTSAVHIGGLKYKAVIPEAMSEGLVYYYPELYDKAVPANISSFNYYSGVHSFRIIWLNGIASVKNTGYVFEVRAAGNGEIDFTLPSPCTVGIRLYDTAGREVVKKSVEMPIGKNKMKFEVAQGVYFVNIETPYGSAKSKMVKLK